MSKEVQMSIKMEAELRRRFMAAAANLHQPAAQIVRELMWSFVERQGIPVSGAKTITAIEAVERAKVNTYVSAKDFHNKLKLGI